MADPTDTARGLDAQTQAVYDALALPHARLDPQSTGGYSAWLDCPPRGISHWLDYVSDNAPTAAGTVSVSGSWDLIGLTRQQAVAAMGRLKKVLAGHGWSVSAPASDDTLLEPTLVLKPPHAEELAIADSVSVTLYPAIGELDVEGDADCARYPRGTRGDLLGGGFLLAAKAPVQLRGR